MRVEPNAVELQIQLRPERSLAKPHGSAPRVLAVPRLTAAEAIALYRRERDDRDRRARESALIEDAKREYLALEITTAITQERFTMNVTHIRKKLLPGGKRCLICHKTFFSRYPTKLTCSASCKHKRELQQKGESNARRRRPNEAA
jgi:hypothetical protein